MKRFAFRLAAVALFAVGALAANNAQASAPTPTGSIPIPGCATCGR